MKITNNLSNISRFQVQLHNLVTATKPDIVVETGFMNGLSAIHTVAALMLNEKGHLYSIDPQPNSPFESKWFTMLKGESKNHMLPLFLKTGPWDIFIHDSDHEVGCTTFEYELAWDFVKPGGFIVSDDYVWGTHYSWKKFCERHGVIPETLGDSDNCSAQFFQKPANASPVGSGEAWAKQRYEEAVKLTNAACKAYKNTPPYFPAST